MLYGVVTVLLALFAGWIAALIVPPHVNRSRHPFLPRAALRLGFLGLAPLAIAALVSLSQHADTAHLGAVAFRFYAAVLLSFLGGVRCGFELMRAPQSAECAAPSVQRAAGAGGLGAGAVRGD